MLNECISLGGVLFLFPIFLFSIFHHPQALFSVPSHCITLSDLLCDLLPVNITRVRFRNRFELRHLLFPTSSGKPRNAPSRLVYHHSWHSPDLPAVLSSPTHLHRFRSCQCAVLTTKEEEWCLRVCAWGIITLRWKMSANNELIRGKVHENLRIKYKMSSE